jgi:acetyl esterase/lipase
MKRTLAVLACVWFGAALASPQIAWAQQEKAAEYEVKAIRDVVYKTVDGVELKLNLFLPQRDGKTRENTPLLMNIDAGCWFSGKPGSGGQWQNFGAVQKGFAVASVPHRSAKQFPFPAQIEDAKAAVRFLRAHAEEYGLDKSRFACMGYSSGGHISNMLGIPDEVKIFDVGENLDQSSQVQCVINFYGPTDIAYFLRNNPSVDCIYQVCGAKMEDGKISRELTDELLAMAAKCSPITYVTKDSSPSLHFYGVMDRVVPVSQGCMLYEAQWEAGVRTQLYISNTGVHSVKTIASTEELAKMVFEFLDWE